VGNGKLRLRR